MSHLIPQQTILSEQITRYWQINSSLLGWFRKTPIGCTMHTNHTMT